MTVGNPPRTWTRLLGVAIGVGLAALVAGSSALALWYVESQSRSIIIEQYAETLEDDLELFFEIRKQEGLDGLLRAVERRARTPESLEYIAARTPEGDLLAGNLDIWPVTVATIGRETPGPLKPVRNAVDGASVFVAAQNFGDVIVIVGLDDRAIRDFHTRLTDSVWVGVGFVVIVCLGIAIAISTFILRRVQTLSASASRVAAGDYATRAPGAESSGPFGEIARALNTMLDHTEDLVTGLRTVTDSLAHDLRTPLARVHRQLEAGVLSDSAEEKQACLESALAETSRTLNTFSSLVEIARAQGGLSREAMSIVQLDDLARDVVDLFDPLAEENGVRLTTDLQRCSIEGHKPLLMQAMSNLLHNAIKFAPPDTEVRVALSEGADCVCFLVADHGVGIAEDKRAEAVQRFRQVSAGEAPEGLGLGLAIVQACAHLHRGRLELADNEPGLKAILTFAPPTGSV